jgi:hypothetical protein
LARNKGPKPPKAPAGPKYEHAPEDIQKLAARLIDQHHSRLAEANISYIMRNGTWKKKGDIVDADVSVISGANRFELGTNFRITINTDVWNQATEDVRAYILDKQLSKCVKEETASGDVKWSTRDFYLKEFPSLIERYGVVTDEQRRMVDVLKQTKTTEETEAMLA